MDESTIQEQFAVVEEMTQQQKEQAFSVTRDSILADVQQFGINDLEINEAILALVHGLIWLKQNNGKEGTITLQYKKKKNIRDSAEANVVVRANYKTTISEDEKNVITKTFIDKGFHIDA